MLDEGDDLGARLEGGHLDFPRMREGGLTGAFFSVWVDPRRYQGDAAWERARALARVIREATEAHSDEAAFCTTADEVRAAAANGRLAVLMGVEGAHALGSAEPATLLSRLREIHAMGARYLTITWSTDNPLGHASTGDAPAGGLTVLGREVIREMNRLGMMVDVSHVSDQTFDDIMDVTERPVLASHSSARALAEHPRNMRDDMIRRVAEGGGVVCVNFYADYIDPAYRERKRRLMGAHRGRFRAAMTSSVPYTERGGVERDLALAIAPDLAPPTIEVLGAHFDHIAEVGGAETVCLGSDFDGVSELPVGLDDVADLPALREELARRGLDVGAIFGENLLRVLGAQRAPL
jgi:membrane dipeptidase